MPLLPRVMPLPPPAKPLVTLPPLRAMLLLPRVMPLPPLPPRLPSPPSNLIGY